MDQLSQTTERLAIQRLIAVYAQLLDEGRLEDWGQLFTEEARFRAYGRTYASRATIVAEIGSMVLPPDHPAKHMSLVPLIDFTADGRALAWTDFSGVGANDSGEIVVGTIGRYYDELVRDGERWRFASRTIVMAGEPRPDDVAPSPAF
jgi:3-phenylpropionate/cinnamic acid dioxygenase small subunit